MTLESSVELGVLRAWLREHVGELAGIPAESVELHRRFRELGLQSEQVLRLIERLGRRVGRKLPGIIAWEHPTPEALARHVVEPGSTPATQAPRLADKADKAHKPSTAEPIAIIGMACRLPGGVHSPDEYWQLLSNKRSGVREIPRERFDLEAYFDADVEAPGKLCTRFAGLLDDIQRFDAEFFGITPREARHMDPQQRLALELAWQAIEDAGIDPSSLRGAQVGVFIGAMWSDYARLLHQDVRSIDAYTATGQDTSIISGRVSYALGLTGTSLTVNSACSSSALAVHLALQSLRSGEVQLALAGGVHLMASPESTVALTKFGAMNPAGQCRAFDAGANGYVRGEGAGVLLLKPLSRALADGDDIYCVLRGSAANNDGFSNGLTAPNPLAQQAVIRQALANAGVNAASIDYVEAHGPGTVLGDPLEANALGAVFAEERREAAPLRIGSVKTNLGHLEAAAGIAGLMKVALCLWHRALVPSLHFDKPNPMIPFERLRLQVQSEFESWPNDQHTPRVGLSAFGFGGTNCHLVAEAAPCGSATLVALAGASADEVRARALAAFGVLSRARSARQAHALAGEICARAPADAPYRAAIVGQSARALAQALTELVSGSAVASERPVRPRLVYVCAGQGAHWRGMARATLGSEPSFRAALEACDAAIRERYGWSLIDELVGEQGAEGFDAVEVAQLAQFSIQFAFGTMWSAWGLAPDCIVGHSLGEVAACCLAGVLTLQEAVLIVGVRASAMRDPAAQGGMLSVTVELPERVAEMFALASPLELAVHNSPVSYVFSGSAEGVVRAQARLQAAGIDARAVQNVPLAGHSSHMDNTSAAVRAALGELRPRPARIPVRSSVIEAWLAGPECDASYWAANVRQTVRFAQAVDAVCAAGPCVFLELGAHPVLLKAVSATALHGPHACTALASAYRGEDERRCRLETLAQLYRAGFDPRWPAIFCEQAERVASESVLDLTRGFAEPPAQPVPPLVPLLVSAQRAEALPLQLQRLAAELGQRPFLDVAALARASAGARAGFEARAVVLGRDRGELIEALAPVAGGAATPRLIAGAARSSAQLALHFTGQGSQREHMGLQLARAYPDFRAQLDGVLAAFAPPLRAALDAAWLQRGDGAAGQLAETQLAQPAIFALEVALYRFLEALGVRAGLVFGHSLGELAAAHVAGVMSLGDACTLVEARARLMQALPRDGAMLAVQAGEHELAEWLARDPESLALAAVNGPESLVLSGKLQAIDEIERALRTQGRPVSRLRVSHAFHSPCMDPMLAAFADVVSKLRLSPPELPLVSSVTGQLAAPETFTRVEYWVRQVRETVRYSEALRSARMASVSALLELGPSAVLTPLAQEQHPELPAWACLAAERDEVESVLTALGQLHVHGCEVRWPALFAGCRPQRVKLPVYAFCGERFWVAPAARAERHAALGSRALLAELETAGDVAALGEQLGANAAQRAALAEVSPLLCAWHARERERAALEDKCYDVSWLPLTAAARGPQVGRWLLLSAERPLCAALARALEQAGGSCLEHALEGDELALEALRSEPLCGILLVATDASAPPDQPELPRSLWTLTAAIQAWQRALPQLPLWVITRGAVAVDAADPAPSAEQAMVCAFARVASLEHPERWGGLIDLAADLPLTAACEQVPAALAVGGGEDELALRTRGVFARRLVRAPQALAAVELARYPGTALITGGTGALGVRVARFLAARGAGHLVLTSRSGGNAAALAALQRELSALGARLTIRALDVADRAALQQLLAELAATGEVVNTVVHAAGINEYAPITTLSRARLAAVLRAKVLGARNLDELLPGPQHFVLFASGAGVWGSATQAAYAAANAYLDALAQRRAKRGLSATSIAWSIWGGGGMASSALAQLRRRGLLPLEPELALTALERALAARVTTLTVGEFDWPLFAAAYAAERERPLLAQLGARPADLPQPASAETDRARSFSAELRQASGARREQLLLTSVCEVMAQVLGVDARTVHPTRALKELGMDSLMAVQLRNRLSGLTGLRLPTTLLFNYPTPLALGQYLGGRLVDDAAAPSPEAALFSGLERLAALEPRSLERDAEARLLSQLRALATKWQLALVEPAALAAHGGESGEDDSIFGSDQDDEAMFRVVDESLAAQGTVHGDG